jgi:hypothetical protein
VTSARDNPAIHADRHNDGHAHEDSDANADSNACDGNVDDLLAGYPAVGWIRGEA